MPDVTLQSSSKRLTWRRDQVPTDGARLLLLNKGGVPVIGSWTKCGSFLAWCAVPVRESLWWRTPQTHQNELHGRAVLLLTCGGTPAMGAWKDDAGFVAWCELPQ